MPDPEADRVESLGTKLPEETARCRELLSAYRALGPAGTFAAASIESALREADRTMIEQDLPGMIRVYHRLRGFE